MHSTKSTIVFVFIMTAIVAVILAGMFTALKPIHDSNEAIYNKRAILSAVKDHLGEELAQFSDEKVQEVFETQIEQLVVDGNGEVLEDEYVASLGYGEGKAESVDLAKEVKKPDEDRVWPVFIYTSNGGKKFTIISTRGKGLWDAIWASVALEDDLNTIAGVAFDHQAETPGLGAEIKDNPTFYNQFVGKKIFEDGQFRGIYVRKGGAKDPVYEVDGISGATITADGVTAMLKNDIQNYEPYFNTVKG